MKSAMVRVLTVDDSRSVRSYVRQALEQDRECLFTVDEAGNGAEAVRFLSGSTPENWPDVILLDRNMPVMSGDECIRILKASEQWQWIPVLFLTGQKEVQEIVQGLSDLKADSYLSKPFHVDELLARIKALLRIKQAENQNRILNAQLAKSLVEQQQAYQELKETKTKLLETRLTTSMMRTFEKFVPKQFLQRIAKGGMDSIRVGWVESETITMLFSDIRSFTRLSEVMTPESLFVFLNEYLRHVVVQVKNNNGFVDKFMGDAVMALFDGDSRVQVTGAARAAVGMQNKLRNFNMERATRGLEAVDAGIGIHIGSVMLGTLGDEDRMDCTVVGDAVNLASRLEGLTKYYGCPIIISENVVRLLDMKEFAVRELDQVVVKGRKGAIGVYELFENGSEPVHECKRKLAKLFDQGLLYYRWREWEKSAEIFKECLTIDPDDRPAKLYWERCEQVQREPPDMNWTGIFEIHQK
ncbi:MAG: response regulator [Magnetococcus sp. YQC-3]